MRYLLTDKSMYCFGGYDGGYRNDFHEFSFGKLDKQTLGLWSQLQGACHDLVHNHTCILFGGHDGSLHLNDVHVYDFGTFSSGLFYLTSGNEISETRVWLLLATEGQAPLARDSHVASQSVGSKCSLTDNLRVRVSATLALFTIPALSFSAAMMEVIGSTTLYNFVLKKKSFNWIFLRAHLSMI
ncbi:hypothetical protein PsorP6_016930 [Peronosclerospora sorghi]|uniref:Uncharacterized protein n=1 Tax=Peronosclerospora sorghi TaxID=230839 RepID=A0ACC0WBU3_9STRA|nr:hypothetical protein PsorP6_016930 [Peronosclerospora sorghi]